MFGRSAAGEPTWDAFKRDGERVRRGFWPKVRRISAKPSFTENLLAAYYCAFDRKTPMQVKAARLGALAYFVLPADTTPWLGFADDALMLVTALWMVSGHIRDEHRDDVREAPARTRNDAC